ncbi:MAG: DUF6636 domain-containing protein [Paracoccaceae bacterium]
MMFKSLAVAAIFASLASPTLAREQAVIADAEGVVEFNLPSGNIACIFIPQGGSSVYYPVDGGPELSCTRVEPVYVIVTLGPKGRAKAYENPGERGCCSEAQVLQYGNSWSAGPFHCTSAKTGLTCTSGNGHGFSMSRARITLK